VIGKTLDEALKITNQDIADFLGGLPPEKMHCSVMGYEALQSAVANFRGKSGRTTMKRRACLQVLGVDEGLIERAIKMNKLTSVEQVTDYTKAGGGCLTCFDKLEEILARTNADWSRGHTGRTRGLPRRRGRSKEAEGKGQGRQGSAGAD